MAIAMAIFLLLGAVLAAVSCTIGWTLRYILQGPTPGLLGYVVGYFPLFIVALFLLGYFLGGVAAIAHYHAQYLGLSYYETWAEYWHTYVLILLAFGAVLVASWGRV